MSNIYHKHHIIPKHAGGTNNPDNFIYLSIADHAEAHRLLYKEYGRWQDKLAWKALSGSIGREEIIRQRVSLTHKGNPKSPEQRAKISVALKGKTHTSEHRKNNSEAQKEWNHHNTNPFKGKHHTSQTKKHLSNIHPGYKHLKAKPVTINNITYLCISWAAQALSVSNPTIRNRIRSKNFPEYYLPL
tara:strand:- start:12651 stop:13211 length:561 start_codon:yes stop_codon:yes gene_type:complete